MDFNKIYRHLYNWFLINGPRLLLGVVLLLAGLWLIRILSGIMQRHMHRRQVDPTVKPFLLSLIGVVMRVLLIIGVMQFVGIRLTLFTAVVGAFGVAAGLALSGTLQNFASGVLILLLKPFVVGDNIITQGQEGTVTSIQIFYTLITTFDNRSVIVPNSKLSNEVIVNISRMGSRRLDIHMKFPNAVDVGQVKDIINTLLDDYRDVLKTPQWRIGVVELQFDGFVIETNVWIHAHGYQDVKLQLQEAILQKVKAAGIKLAGM